MKEFEYYNSTYAPEPDYVLVANLGEQDNWISGTDFWSLLAISAIEIGCGLIYAIYRMANYAHAGDNEFGRSRFARISVSMGIFMWTFPILWVPVDVLLSQHSDTARNINYWIVMCVQYYQLFYLWIMCPLILSFYESDAQDTMCRRWWYAIRLQLPLIVFVIIVTVPSYFLINEVSITGSDL